jgi:hypothetical protein
MVPFEELGGGEINLCEATGLAKSITTSSSELSLEMKLTKYLR